MSSHIGSLYGIQTILSGEIEGIPIDFKERNTPSQDLTSLMNEHVVVRVFSLCALMCLADSTGISSLPRYSKVP